MKKKFLVFSDTTTDPSLAHFPEFFVNSRSKIGFDKSYPKNEIEINSRNFSFF